MGETGSLKVMALGERGIVMSRVIRAPREQVFEAYTRPEWVPHWLGAFGGWEMDGCEIDPRAGGTWRYTWRGPHGERMGWSAVCREFSPPSRIATVARFDEPWHAGEEEGSVTFGEVDSGRTEVTLTVRYASAAVRDEVLRSPMSDGVAASFDALESLVEAPQERWMDAEAGVP